jgi:S-adenosylmethionine:diacylglycerol 3-amino-3-carboxypropyl transferase
VSEIVWQKGRLLGSGDPSVIFGFQHEDATVEASSFPSPGSGRALCIASGGETAFSLLAAGAAEVVAVDVNGAQLRLIEVKVIALTKGRRDWLTEDASSILSERDLSAEARSFWERRVDSLRRGLCFSGLVERRTFRLGPLLRWFARHPSGWRWKTGWWLLHLAISTGYAAGFRRSLPEGWATRLEERVKRALKEERRDPLWLAELGLGFGSGELPVYADDSTARLKDSLSDLRLVESDLPGYLRDHPEEAWDLIALSNIGDTMGDSERRELLRLVVERLAPGGIVVMRSIVHSPDAMPEVASCEWLPLPPDREVVCPVIGVGRKC